MVHDRHPARSGFAPRDHRGGIGAGLHCGRTPRFGFGPDRASTWSEITSAVAYFGLAALALVAPFPDVALALLMVGFVLAAILDRRAALAGNAPLHFARLRPPQLAIGVISLAALWAWLAAGGSR